jgi:rubrerythrin
MSILKGEAALARKLHAQKETTGRIINHPPSEAYAEGWDRVFGKKKERPTVDGMAFIKSHPSGGDFWICTGCHRTFGAEQELRCPRCDE